MRFSASEQLHLPCRFAEFVPGQPHADGRRYLPMVVLRSPSGVLRPGVEPAALGVVDRHHVVAPELEGQDGVAKLVLLLSTIRLQEPPFRTGLVAEPGAAGPVSTRPLAYGRVVGVPTWEAEREHLPYEALYTELLLDIGDGIVGVRTSVTADDLAAAIGKARLEEGDWLEVGRSRIDILDFSR